MRMSMALAVAMGFFLKKSMGEMSDTLSDIALFEREHPDIAAAHAEMERMMLEEFAMAEKAMRDADARFLQQISSQPRKVIDIDAQKIHDDTCTGTGGNEECLPPNEMPKENINSPTANKIKTPHHHKNDELYEQYMNDRLEQHSHHGIPRNHHPEYSNDAYDDEHDHEESVEDDFDDEYTPRSRGYSKQATQRDLHLSSDEIEERIKQQVRAQLMEAKEAYAQMQWGPGEVVSSSTVCLPYPLHSMCDFNIIAGVLWTILVVFVVLAVSRTKPSAPAKKMKTK